MSVISAQETKAWYDKLNAILAGHGLSGIAVPKIAGPARAGQVTPLTDKLDEMKTDTYYRYADYADWGSVCAGAVMHRATPDGIGATLESIETKIVCRNTATYANGTNSNGTYSDGTRTFDSDSYGTCSKGVCSKDTKSNGTCSNGTYSDGWHSNGEVIVTHSNGTNWHGDCTVATYGTNAGHNNGTCSKGSNSGPKGNGAKSNGTKSNGNDSNGTNTKGYNSNGTNSVSNSYGTYSDGTKNNGTKSDGTTIDVGNSNSRK